MDSTDMIEMIFKGWGHRNKIYHALYKPDFFLGSDFSKIRYIKFERNLDQMVIMLKLK